MTGPRDPNRRPSSLGLADRTGGDGSSLRAGLEPA